MNLLKRILLITVIVVVVIVTVFVVAINVSPKPAIAFTRATLFKIPTDTRPLSELVGDGRVQFKKDLIYTSEHDSNTFDHYQPLQPLENTPTIVWVHGGGFIGGDKLEVNDYAIALAKEGYQVVVMNYALAPETHYPTPVVQASEFVSYLQKNEKELGLNMHNVFVAGDSAGAQIASQYLLTQTNAAYGAKMGISQQLTQDDIKELADHSSSAIINFIFKNIGWGYFNIKNWPASEEAKQADIIANVTNTFPSAYITDGNTASFEHQAKAFITKLESLGVSVDSRFFDATEYQTAHEYQFVLTSVPGQLSLEDTLAFLAKHKS